MGFCYQLFVASAVIILILKSCVFGIDNDMQTASNCFSSLRSKQQMIDKSNGEINTSILPIDQLSVGFVASTLQNCTTACNAQPHCLALEFIQTEVEGLQDCWLYASVPRLRSSPKDHEDSDPASFLQDKTMCFKGTVVAVPFTCRDKTTAADTDYTIAMVSNIEECQDLCNQRQNVASCVGITYPTLSSIDGAASECRLLKSTRSLKADPSFRSCLKRTESGQPAVRPYVVETVPRKLNTSIYVSETAEAINNVIEAVTQLDQMNLKAYTAFLITGSPGSGKSTLAIQICDYFIRTIASFADAEIRRFLRQGVNSLNEFVDAIEQSQIVIIDEFLFWTKDPLGQDMMGYLMERLTPESGASLNISKMVVFTGYDDGYQAMAKFNAGWERRLVEVIPVLPLPVVVASATLRKLRALNVTCNTTALDIAQLPLFTQLSTTHGFGVINMVWVEALMHFRRRQSQPLQLSDFGSILAKVQRRRRTRHNSELV